MKTINAIVRNFDRGDVVVKVVEPHIGIVGVVSDKIPSDVEHIATHIKVKIDKRDIKYLSSLLNGPIPFEYFRYLKFQRAGDWRLIDARYRK